MCTVTYLPIGNNQFILTSNRDESPMRKTIAPKKYDEQGVALVYPKDELAGGTWIGLSEKNRLVCLLNGGFEIHERKGPYAMSRGLIVKKILSAENSVTCIENFIFDNIEPFTLVLVDWKNSLATYELVWDGVTKHFTELAQAPKIWSSSALYTSEMKASRRAWFADWLSENKTFQQQEIINFQTSTNKGTPETSLKMKRNFVETVSVTSVKKEEDICLIYNDLLKGKTSKKTIVF
jgi:uncharacterized protein with NRDE domain